LKQVNDFHYLILEPGLFHNKSELLLYNLIFLNFAVTVAHGGQYSVTATNCGGRAQSIADVAVIESRPEISLEVKKLVFEDIEEEVLLTSDISYKFCSNVTFLPCLFLFSLSWWWW
jgi:hypothetical protein